VAGIRPGESSILGSVTDDLLERARRWLAEDPDPATRAELEALLDAGDRGELAARFSGTLRFGTAGLRGTLGAGPMRMNRAVVARAAAGLAAYLVTRGGGTLVVGFDARHGSRRFALDTVEVAAGAGLDAVLLPGPIPTPVLAFAVRHLGAAAGVMVTASHNPPRDNGYKVYLGDGSQIVPPADQEISAAIDAVGPLPAVPRSDAWTQAGEEIVAAYLARAAGVLAPGTPRDLRIAYTPLHGVGARPFARALQAAGFPPARVVAEQAEPDPDFPTVAFPNPEEPGTLDRALAFAREQDADLLIAHDPDADRCALAIPAGHGWRVLTGDEIGVLLAAHLIRRDGRLDGTLACSIVSSALLGRLAAAHGIAFRQTLTGFKWISRVPGLRYGYEEALGYCADPEAVRDKDGITAALLAAELAATLKAEGRGLQDLLDDLAREHGVHATRQLSIRRDDPASLRAILGRLRDAPPRALGGRRVIAADDLAAGLDGLPPTDGLRLRLERDARVIVRPSGTEPKVKCYLEVVEPVAGGDVAAARATAAAALDALGADLRRAL
jgi:phosphomannomutase